MAKFLNIIPFMRGLFILVPILLVCTCDLGCGGSDNGDGVCKSGYNKCPGTDVCCEDAYPYHKGDQCYSRPPDGASVYCGPGGNCADGYVPCPTTDKCCQASYPYHAGDQCYMAPPANLDEYCGNESHSCDSGYYPCPGLRVCCPAGYPYHSGSSCHGSPPAGYDAYCG